ncbi:MAG: carboxylating nicotinate-nucleotide diphosphorylase [Candidatus Omnitrophota bacterium]|jgi:nicotinate-nucleotide pyrophosphorylase (carboxylating)
MIDNISNLIVNALREDIGSRDITTQLFIPGDKFIKAVFLAKEPCVICGLNVAQAVFKSLDRAVKFKALARDGAFVKRGRIIARIEGRARSVLTAERVALNFLTRLSGIATTTRKFVTRVRPYKVKIIDTRKTTPGLRLLEKYAVRTGGGFNHRLSLDEMILVKDNHLKALGGINKLPGSSRKYKTEIEVKNLKEFNQALKLQPDMIMLDNMGLGQIKKIVSIKRKLQRAKRKAPLLEASGGITLKNVKKVASCGIDMISVGALTHSPDSADISLEIL